MNMANTKSKTRGTHRRLGVAAAVALALALAGTGIARADDAEGKSQELI